MHVFIYYYMSFIVIVIIIITIIISMGTVGTCCSVFFFFFFSFSMNCFSFLGCRACSVPVIPLTSVQCLQMTVNSFPLTAQC